MKMTMAQEETPAISQRTLKTFQVYKPCELSHSAGQHGNPDRISKVNAKMSRNIDIFRFITALRVSDEKERFTPKPELVTMRQNVVIL